MAALIAGGPRIAGPIAGFGPCAASSSDSSVQRAAALPSGRPQCSGTAVGWSSSSLAGEGVGPSAGLAGPGQRARGVHVRAEAKDESFLQGLGSQFFKIGGTKSDGKGDGKAGKGGGPKPPSGGSQFFKLGSQKAKKEEPKEEPKRGSQLFKFGSTKKESAGTKPGTTKTGTKKTGTTNGSAFPVAKGTAALESLSFGRGRRVDPKTVFVAGATGQIGSRISQQLLRVGLNVRGGVPDLFVAQQLAEFATEYGVIRRDEAKRLNAVEFDFKNMSSIAKGLGNAGKVVVTVGPAEDGPLGKVTTDDAYRVLEAATLSNTGHFVLVTDPGLGVSPDGGPLAGLVALFSKVFTKPAEISEPELIDKIVESGLPYTIVRASSSDGVDDYAPDGGNLVIEAEGATDPSSKVSKIQIASAVAGVFQNAGASADKFLEVTSGPYAPSRPVDELLSAIQVDGRRAALKEEQARREAEQKDRKRRSLIASETEEAVADARRAAQLAAQLEGEAKKLAAEEAKAAASAAKAQARADAAAASVDGLQVKAKELGGGPLKAASGSRSSPSSGTGSLKVEDKIKKAIPFPKKQQQQPEKQPAPAAASPKSGTGLFGGLFAQQQEAIYVDD